MYNREKIINILHDIKNESEEITPYVIVAQPRRNLNEIPAQKLNGNDGIHIDLCGYSHGFVDVGGESVDVARNYLIEQVLNSDAKYLFFIGEDTVIPWDGFTKLHEVAEKNPDSMIVGVYYIKLSIPMIMIRTDNHITPADVAPGQVYETWQTGLDAALIPVKLLRELYETDPEIPFCVIANNIEDVPFVGEDNFFAYRWRKMGFKTLCNTDVQCLHMDLASGKYTAYPKIDENNYFTNIKLNGRLTMADKKFIDKRWLDRLPNKIKRTDIINLLFEKYNFKSYLEIGVSDPTDNFDKINAILKHSVDPIPNGKYTYNMVSDDFFKQCDINQKYDVIFIDGLHTEDQSYKDVLNSIDHLNDDGFIVMHDCNPENEYISRNYEEYLKDLDMWSGDVYKAFIKLKRLLIKWSCFVVNEDYGCGILTKRDIIQNSISELDISNLTFDDFDKNRNELLQLITFDDYKKIIN